MESSMRRPCFIEDDGLASIAVIERPGFSGNNNYHQYQYCNQNQTFLGSSMMRRRNSLKNMPCSPSCSLTSPVSVCSPRSGRFYDSRFEEPHSPHFLEACALCNKPLGDNRDIFMYRGDTPFCSEECRQEQIEIDEAKEKNWSLKALRTKKDTTKSSSNTSSTSTPSKNYPFRTGTVAAA